MPVAALLNWLTSHYLLQKVLRLIGSGLLGLFMLGWIVSHSGPTRGMVVVHVVERDVQLHVGPEVFRVRHAFDPIVCKLPAGEYTLTMTRGDRTLDEQTFQVRGGDWLCLTAFDRAAYRSRPLAAATPTPRAGARGSGRRRSGLGRPAGAR